MIGELIDHYRVLELIGRGAMGVVYKALDVNLDRPVAIKVMSTEVRNDPDFVERFRQEARVQAALNHPNVAQLFDYFVNDGAPVVVMEFIDGESLEEMIRRRGPIQAHESIPIFKQALRGVAAAHRAGIIHRDLKPANLMLTKDGVVKVMDFGIAKRQGVTGATKVSTSIGSPLYMAPEQILGRAVDYRTDVYALGTTLYQLLSGQPPFNPRGKSEYVVLSAHVNDQPESPTVHCRDIPLPIAEAVMRALSKEPSARFQSADDFMCALPDVAAPSAPRSAPGALSAQRVTPSGTLVLERTAGTSPPEPPAPRVTPSGTVVLERPAATLRQELWPQRSASPVTVQTAPAPSDQRTSILATPSPAAAEQASVPHPIPRQRVNRPTLVAVLVSIVIAGTLIRHVERLHATRASAISLSSPLVLTSPEAKASAVPSAEITPTTNVPAPAPPLAATSAPALPDLSGTWRGEYIDASGKQLLRIISLSISQVHEDGGIEGTLSYEAPSGNGECKLHPRGSTYSANEQRLQLSPEGCSPNYPKELGVPLDFDSVDPLASTPPGTAGLRRPPEK